MEQITFQMSIIFVKVAANLLWLPDKPKIQFRMIFHFSSNRKEVEKWHHQVSNRIMDMIETHKGIAKHCLLVYLFLVMPKSEQKMVNKLTKMSMKCSKSYFRADVNTSALKTKDKPQH